MGQTPDADPLIALRRAGDALIRALCATTVEEEADHRLRADPLIRDAMSCINRARDRSVAWRQRPT